MKKNTGTQQTLKRILLTGQLSIAFEIRNGIKAIQQIVTHKNRQDYVE